MHRLIRIKYNNKVKRIKKAVKCYSLLPLDKFQDNLNTLHDLYNNASITDFDLFAIIYLAFKYKINVELYDTQLIAVMALSDFDAANVLTGEGKTYICAFAATIWYFRGRTTHIVTANLYLANRDHEALLPLYDYLGIKTTVLTEADARDSLKNKYKANIIYGTVQKYVFDYLGDFVATDADKLISAKLDYCLIDELDHIVIDEATTPLVLSTPANAKTLDLTLPFYIAGNLSNKNPDEEKNGIVINDKDRQVYIKECGYEYIEQQLVDWGVIPAPAELYTPTYSGWLYMVNICLLAIHVFKNDRDYVIVNGQVKIVSRATGRIGERRKWQGGIHNALEIKEGLEPSPENAIKAQITVKNYLKEYTAVKGLSATVKHASEFLKHFYNLKTFEVPRHKNSIRYDNCDRIVSTKHEKQIQILSLIEGLYKKTRPVLLRTSSVEESEEYGELLSARGIKHNILNAKQDSHEANIIASAGDPGAVTIATSMAGRGVDIALSKNYPAQYDKLNNLGGLMVIGSERGLSRRYDDQLVGRTARHSSRGECVFYISLEDNLFEFISETNGIQRIENAIPKDDYIDSRIIDKVINKAQIRVEKQQYARIERFQMYDDVVDKYRKYYFSIRKDVHLTQEVSDYIHRVLLSAVKEFLGHKYSSNIDLFYEGEMIEKALFSRFGIDVYLTGPGPTDVMCSSNDIVVEKVEARIEERLHQVSDAPTEDIRQMVLEHLEAHWLETLESIEEARKAAWMKAYAQLFPIVEFEKICAYLFRRFYQNHLAALLKDIILKKNEVSHEIN